MDRKIIHKQRPSIVNYIQEIDGIAKINRKGFNEDVENQLRYTRPWLEIDLEIIHEYINNTFANFRIWASVARDVIPRYPNIGKKFLYPPNMAGGLAIRPTKSARKNFGEGIVLMENYQYYLILMNISIHLKFCRTWTISVYCV